MKRMLTILVVVLLLGLSNYGLAQETEETPTTITIGLKMWYASWEETFTVGTYEETQESDYGLMYGPVLNIRSGNLFLGLSYLMGSFTFEDSWTDSGYYGYYGGDYYYWYDDIEWKSEADRTDVDLSIGYYFHPNLALFLGYKTSNFEFRETWTVTETISNYYTDTYEYEFEDTREMELSGPALGLTGHFPIGESRWILFGTLSYISLASKFEGEAGPDFTGPAYEFGAAYIAETMPVSVTVGYKYQKYEAEEEGVTLEEIFSGLTVGVNYTF